MATILHPVFFTSNAARKIEIEFGRETGEMQVSLSKVIKDCFLCRPTRAGQFLVSQESRWVAETPP